MIQTTKTRLSIRRNLRVVVILLVATALTEALYKFFPMEHGAVTTAGLGLVATAVVLFLSFRVGEAYDRWWEARKLWGAMVNDSRTWGRQVLTFLTADRVPGLAAEAPTELVRRHIGYLYALRTHLRFGTFSPAHLAEVAHYLPESEVEAMLAAPNAPVWLNFRQGQRLRELLGPDFAQQQLLIALDDTLRRFLDIQGGCERIKNTVFPATVTSSTRLFVWMLALSIPFTLVNTEGISPFVEVLASVLTGFMFVKMESLGSDLKNPFSNQPDDTPMNAICRAIERDLLAELGQTHLPPPVQAQDGVLM